MTIGLQILFWASLLGVAYIFAGYPLLVWYCAKKWPRPRIKHCVPRSLSIVIVANNEAKNLPKKITSLLSCHHSEWISEILIGSDGSTDDTATVVRSIADPRVKVIEFAERRGKPAVLNDVVPMATGEFVLLADSRQEFDPACLERLLENFEDPSVGVVSGELVFRNEPGDSTAAQGIGFYWKYEKFIRKCESAFRGVPGATGACYVIRRSLFKPIPPQTILDDVVIPMQAIVQGFRCLFEPNAVIYDTPSKSTRQESIRKRRTIAGAAQLVQLFPSWIVPMNNPIWTEYVSHKLMRLVSPLLLLIVVATNVALIANPFYALILIAQVAFYCAALSGWVCQSIGRRVSCFGPPLMFVTLNLTTVLALWDAARSRYRVTWQR